MKNYAGNIQKMFWYLLSQRRNYIAILSIYFLTLPDARAQQIGFFTAIGTFAAFLFELPSGYISDRIGHRKTLIIAKVLMLLSTSTFLLAKSWHLFALGAIFLNVSFAFTSGTKSAFIHESLFAMKKDGDFTKIMSRISGNVSLFSGALMFTLPFFTAIFMLLPILINLLFDIFGLFVAISFVAPPQKLAQRKKSFKYLLKDFHGAVKPGFYRIAFFVAIVSGILFALTPYRAPYLEFLGLPVVLVGLTMTLSRIVWFFFARVAHDVERMFSIKTLLRLDVVIFPLLILCMALSKSPLIVLLLLAVAYGYKNGRSSIIDSALMARLKKREYKATALSFSGQLTYIFDSLFLLVISPFLESSYAYGFRIIAITSFVVLLAYSFFLSKDTK